MYNFPSWGQGHVTLMHCHVTSCDTMWPHVTFMTSCDLMWHHVTSCDTMWHHVTLWYVIPCDLMWYHVTSCDIMWHHVTSCDTMWHYVTSCDTMWPHVTSCDIIMINTYPSNHEVHSWALVWACNNSINILDLNLCSADCRIPVCCTKWRFAWLVSIYFKLIFSSQHTHCGI